MATIFILAGSFLGFVLAVVSVTLGSDLVVGMLLWIGSGLIASALSVALALVKPQNDPEETLTQSA